MKHTCAVLCLICAGTVLSGFQQGTSPQDGKTNQKTSKTDNQNPQSTPQKSSPPSSGQSSPSPADDHPDRKSENQYQYMKITAPEKPINRIELVVSIIGVCGTIVLAGVGIYGICIGLRTLRFLGQQTVANVRAARAAKISSDALINIERAWLVLVKEEMTDPDAFWNRVRVKTQGGQYEFSVSVKFLNYGHTPAWVVESAFDLLYTDVKERELSLNPSDPRKLDHVEAIPPGGKGFTQSDIKMRPRKQLDAAEFKRVEDGESFLYLYGYLRYQDVFREQADTLRETRFCYCLAFVRVPNGYPAVSWRLCGPEGANRAT